MAKLKSSRRSRPARPTPNAISMLTADHQRVTQLFKKFEDARRGEQKDRLATEICSELKVHAQLEEEIFYPVARQATGEQDLMDEAEVEHASAKELIEQIEAGSHREPLWEAKVTVLGEYIKHHVKEEQGEMFKKVRASDVDLKALGEQMQARKERLQAEIGASPPRKGFGALVDRVLS